MPFMGLADMTRAMLPTVRALLRTSLSDPPLQTVSAEDPRALPPELIPTDLSDDGRFPVEVADVQSTYARPSAQISATAGIASRRHDTRVSRGNAASTGSGAASR